LDASIAACIAQLERCGKQLLIEGSQAEIMTHQLTTKHKPQSLEIAGQATVENAQIGGIAGHDLTVNQIQGQFIHVTVQDPRDFSAMLDQNTLESRSLQSQRDYRQRQVLLNKVKQFWVVGVLKKSLFAQTLLELEFKSQSHLIDQPFDQYIDVEIPVLSQATPSIPELFDQMGEGRTLLILGEPGSGKTTILLKLAEQLIANSDKDLSRPIPVVLNLSSWTKKHRKLADWLVEELHYSYKVSKALAQEWVSQQQLLLLLDGLDEVEVGVRAACAQAINQFIQSHGTTEMVICCRHRDYEALPLQLSLQGAICVEALQSQHIQQYIAQVSQPLTGLQQLLENNPDLQAFASSPLNLSVMCIAYRGCSPSALRRSASTAQLLPHLWAAYMERMLRRHATAQTYEPRQLHQWLKTLALSMAQSSQTVFLIEQLQPDWLGQRRHYWLYKVSLVVLGSSLFGLLGLGCQGYLGGSVGLLTSGLILGRSTPTIETVETMKWSTPSALKHLLPSFKASLPLGLTVGVLLGAMGMLSGGILSGISLGSTYGICGSLVFAIIAGLKGPAIATKTKPNQGIFESFHIALMISGIGGVLGSILGLSFSASWATLGLIYGMTTGFLYGGGQTCLQHFWLRVFLCRNGSMPWNYARFLDEAVERVLLQKVGGGYLFIHRQLRDYLADPQLQSSDR